MINSIKSKYTPIGQFAGKSAAQLLAEAQAKAKNNPFSGANAGKLQPAPIGKNPAGMSPVYTPVGSQFGGGTFVSDAGVGVPVSKTGGGATVDSTVPTTTNKTPPVASSAFSGKTFSRFFGDDMITNQTELVTGGVWSTGVGSLTTHVSSSTQTITQRRYYVDVLNSSGSADSLVQYSIAYGHAFGSGSDSIGQISDSPTKAIYSQFKQLLLNPDESKFTTQGSGSTDSIYAITFKRSRMKERLDPGNFEIPLTSITSRDKNATGSFTSGSTIVTLIDDSAINANPPVGIMGRVYNVVSGSITLGVHNSAAPIYYGKAYPDYGVVIIDGNVLDQRVAFKTQLSASIECNNHFALFRAISASAYFTNAIGDKFGFLARNSEKITSSHYFVRIKNSEFNFSNNPSYVTGSQGDIKELSFKKDPITYITTVGLYNDDFQLLAVAKVSKPILKSFSRESLIRVKLDF